MHKILFPEKCGLVDFEDLYLLHHDKHSEADEILFDFTNLQWIGVLQTSLIYGWARSLLSKGKKISVHLPSELQKLKITFFIDNRRVSSVFSVKERKSFFLPGSEKLKIDVYVESNKVHLSFLSESGEINKGLFFESEPNIDDHVSGRVLSMDMPFEGTRKSKTINIKDKKLNLEIEDANQAIWFLERISFFDELNRLGVRFDGRASYPKSFGLAAFKSFTDSSELSSYEAALSKIDQLDSLIGGGADINFIRDGDLKEILLHELGDNAFIHGGGNSVRFAISEFPVSDTQEAQGFLSQESALSVTMAKDQFIHIGYLNGGNRYISWSKSLTHINIFFREG